MRSARIFRADLAFGGVAESETTDVRSDPAAHPASHVTAELLAPLSSEQQRVVDLVATCVAGRLVWPVFDFLDNTLENDGLDALEVLESFPRVIGLGTYSATKCPHQVGQRPAPNELVRLTVLGLSRASAPAAQAIVFAYLSLLPKLAGWRRSQAVTPESPRNLEIRSDSPVIVDAWSVPGMPTVPPRFVWELLGDEPPTSGLGSTLPGDEKWTRHVSREVESFVDVRSVKDYTAGVVAMVYRAPPTAPLAAPSPLDLVGALDYLDTVWRLATNGPHLFELHSAQQVARLAFPAQTEDEFASRLSGLGEVLRSATRSSALPSTARSSRGPALEPLAVHLVLLLPAGEGRLRRAVDTLQAVIDVRDASQHSAASSKGAAALVALGEVYPPASWGDAWAHVSARTIESLDAIREELATLTP
jgi:hypothetical protein